MQVQEPLNSCSIAARLSGSENGLGIPLNAFHGQMGCIYFFEDTLSPGEAPVTLRLCSLYTFNDISIEKFMRPGTMSGMLSGYALL